jgi:hypothetical protein
MALLILVFRVTYERPILGVFLFNRLTKAIFFYSAGLKAGAVSVKVW